MPLDYDAARSLLNDLFIEAEQDLLSHRTPEVPPQIQEACELVFASKTQAYREALTGCAIARIQDRGIDIRLPYVNQGDRAFNGRTLDEKAVNPFLHEHRIPSSKGAYLSVVRRSVTFTDRTRGGLRDKSGYDAFLALIEYLENTGEENDLRGFLRYLLFKFAALREASIVPLSRLRQISLEQFGALISGLLATHSGGRFPVLLVVSAFRTIRDFYSLGWKIEFQGINVSDAASSAGGDITISSGGRTLLAAEVTERPLDRNRIVSTFNTKIAPYGIEDYLFFVSLSSLDPSARLQAAQYFAQGHEVNFLEVKEWIVQSLATMGRKGRTIFNEALMELLDAPDIPRSLKMAWNTQVDRLLIR